MAQINPEMWYTPRELATILKRTENEVYFIVSKCGCTIKIEKAEVLIKGDDIVKAISHIKISE